MRDFLYRNKSYYSELLKLGIPIMIGQIGIIVVGFADNIMVGQHSTDELSAASFVNNLFNLPILFGLGFSYGLTPVIGRMIAQNQLAKAGLSLKCALLTNFIVGLILVGIMGIVYMNIERMGQPAYLIPFIKPYYLIQLCGLCFIMLFNAFKQFADGAMDTRMPMYILIMSNILNIAGNYILIFGHWGSPELGLTGAGISTLISRIFLVIVFAYIFFMTSRYNRFRNGFHKLKARWPDFKQIIRMGLPIAFQMGMETGAFNLSVIMMGWIGAAALAAHQIVGTFTTIGFMMYYGVGSAITILISNRKDSGGKSEVNRIANSGFHLILVLAFFISVLMTLLRNHIGLMFTDSQEVNLLVMWLILPTIAYQIGDGLQIAYANALRGIEDVKPMAIIAFICYFLICLPCGYVFGFILNWGAVGIWCGFPIGLTLAGILYFVRFRYQIRKKNL